MNRILLEGKVSSDCRVETKRKDGIDVEFCRLVVVTQVQKMPDVACQIELQAYDPDITKIMKSIKNGDHIAAEGLMANTFKYENGSRKPAFYYVICTSIKKWNQ